jgi:hypothetical protein
MENSNSKPDDAKIKDGLGRYKPIKRPSADIDNPLVKMLDNLWVNAHIFVAIPIVGH